jgi:chromosomal replication initiation ATPase DnaA
MQDYKTPHKSGNIQTNVLRAHHIWGVISPQVKDLLGDDIYGRWFDDLIPIAIENEKLILQTSANHASLWIKNNYLDTLNLLSGLQEENLKTLVVAPDEEINSSYLH